MRLRLERKGMLSHFIVDNYYIWVFILYFGTFVKINLSVGVYSALLMLLIGMILLFSGKLRKQMSILDALVLVYLVYCIGSVIWVVMHGINVGVYIRSITNSLFPVIFYYCTDNGRWTFYKRFLYSFNICCIVGLILLIMMPSWYYMYCRNYGYSFTRLSSCVGSTTIGSLGAVAVLVSIWMLYESKGKKGKIFYLLSIFYAFASMQRSAWIVVLVSLVIAHYFVFFSWKTIRLRYFVGEVIGILLLGFVVKDRIISMVERWILEHQAAGGYGMFSGRTGQWIEGIKSANLLFGNGYGTMGHKASGYVENIIADGSWACLLCEIGIIGITIFLVILFLTVKKGLYSLKELFLPLGIIVCISLQAVGSNMFEYQIIMPLFWYSIGCISHYKKKNEVLICENFRNISATVS